MVSHMISGSNFKEKFYERRNLIWSAHMHMIDVSNMKPSIFMFYEIFINIFI